MWRPHSFLRYLSLRGYCKVQTPNYPFEWLKFDGFLGLRPICFLWKILNFFIFFLFKINIFFYIFKLFWCVDIRNNFLKIKKYYFNIFFNKKYFKNQLYRSVHYNYNSTGLNLFIDKGFGFWYNMRFYQ
jgi:hypothetical protein